MNGLQLWNRMWLHLAICISSNFFKFLIVADITGILYVMCRYVATELATDIIVNVGDIKFYLHKVHMIDQSSIHF